MGIFNVCCMISLNKKSALTLLWFCSHTWHHECDKKHTWALLAPSWLIFVAIKSTFTWQPPGLQAGGVDSACKVPDKRILLNKRGKNWRHAKSNWFKAVERHKRPQICVTGIKCFEIFFEVTTLNKVGKQALWHYMIWHWSSQAELCLFKEDKHYNSNSTQ